MVKPTFSGLVPPGDPMFKTMLIYTLPQRWKRPTRPRLELPRDGGLQGDASTQEIDPFSLAIWKLGDPDGALAILPGIRRLTPDDPQGAHGGRILLGDLVLFGKHLLTAGCAVRMPRALGGRPKRWQTAGILW